MKRIILGGLSLSVILALSGLMVTYGWFTSKSRETVPVGAANVKIWSSQDSSPGLYTITAKNLGDREIYMRIGAIHEASESGGSIVQLLDWGDSEFFSWLSGARASLETAAIADGDAAAWLASTKASLSVITLKGSAARKAYINIVSASDGEFAKIGPGIAFSFSLSADALPEGTKLTFYPEAIQGTEECLAYMMDPDKSGLAAPWLTREE